jgi:methylmalonyl-CoA mutase C-terminal domain/subunit
VDCQSADRAEAIDRNTRAALVTARQRNQAAIASQGDARARTISMFDTSRTATVMCFSPAMPPFGRDVCPISVSGLLAVRFAGGIGVPRAPAVRRRQSRKGRATMSSRIRVVVAKPGLDGHDRGAKVVARALRDAGMEVIYTGLHQTPEQIVETAIQEDADAVGLSVLSGAHMTLFRKVVELLRERGADDMVVFGGGIIPDADIPELEKLGVAKVFTPGATTQSIVDWVRENVATPVA